MAGAACRGRRDRRRSPRPGVRIRVTAYAALAENMPSGTAYRPSDVLTHLRRQDGRERQFRRRGPPGDGRRPGQGVEDVARTSSSTWRRLTGACVVALGERVAGLMARDDETADLILDAAEAAGELFWQLPIPEEAARQAGFQGRRPEVDRRPDGGALTAAAFLSEFVPTTIAWAHLDIAGPAFNPTSRLPLHPRRRHRHVGPHPGRTGPRPGELMETVRPTSWWSAAAPPACSPPSPPGGWATGPGGARPTAGRRQRPPVGRPALAAREPT